MCSPTPPRTPAPARVTAAEGAQLFLRQWQIGPVFSFFLQFSVVILLRWGIKNAKMVTGVLLCIVFAWNISESLISPRIQRGAGRDG
jgi:hypothetical protein